jgi:hypothetical protein
LLTRELIESENRTDLPGQPYEYRTTPAFLQHFGIRSLEELPPLPGPEGSNLAEVLSETVEEIGRIEPGLELAGASAVSTNVELSNP